MLSNDIELLLKRKDLRSSDRANMQRLVQRLKKGDPLRPYERLLLWTYIERYLGPPISRPG